jgi:putative peptidoglycan lipid II flippase
VPTDGGTDQDGVGLVRSNVVVALGTAASRITGLARVVVFGIVIGQTALADAYDGANNSPNSIYELILGGVLSATLVPLFTRYLADEQRDDERGREARSATEAVVSVAIVAMAVLTVLAVAAAPLIFRVFSLTPAAAVDPAEFRSVGTTLARIFLIQIFFYGLTAIGAALLNARRRFFAAAWTPVLANLVIIVSLLGIPMLMDGAEPGLTDVLDDARLRWLLGLGATGGIAVSALALLPAIRRAGIGIRFRPDWRHPAVRQLVTLSGWTFGYVLANQVALVVVKNLARPGSGDQDAYAKAMIFFQLPHGLLAVSIATTFVPDLARYAAGRDRTGFVERMSLGVRIVSLATLPAAFGLLALSRPLIGALLEHGQFSSTAADNTARTLAGMSIGLAGYSVYLFVLRGFYVHRDTKTPFFVNLFENLANIVLALVLVRYHGVLGLAFAFAIAYTFASIWALRVLARKVRQFPLRPIFDAVWPMFLAAVIMAETVWLVTQRFGANSGSGAVTRVVVGTALGAALYPALLWILGCDDLRRFVGLVTKRRAAARDHPGG